MATLFVNPKLPNYFVEDSSVTNLGSPRSFIDEYEAGMVVIFRNLKPKIDFDFWATLDVIKKHKFTKLLSDGDVPPGMIDMKLDRKLVEAGVEDDLRAQIHKNVNEFFASIIPAYEGIFSGYEFTARRAVWRLSETLNENLHVDSYKEPVPHHFARMFVNLDSQPRIWQTSWQVDEVARRCRGLISKSKIEELSANGLWHELNGVIFGRSSREWWDDEPRHVAYFNPGDVWIVDSRLVAHQIFYGRRAVSIDFFVNPDSMKNKNKFYLNLAEEYRKDLLKAS